MPDYTNGKIYKIIDNTTDMIYIGSTCNTLDVRIRQHIKHFNRWKLGKFAFLSSYSIFENDNDDYCIELIENFSCKTRDELLFRERHYIEISNCINKRIPIRTTEEFKLIDQKYNKQYYVKNIAYYKKKNDDNSEKRKTNYLLNKVEILTKKKESFDCLCGSSCRISDKARHIKTKKHLKYLATL